MTEKEIKRFYNSKEWKRKREKILQRDNFECQDCWRRLREAAEKGIKLFGSQARIRRAEEVHHIKELKDFPSLSLDDDNLISRCVQCNNQRHGRALKQFKKKKILTEEKW